MAETAMRSSSSEVALSIIFEMIFVKSGLIKFSVFARDADVWPAAGSADTELGVLMEPEVCHGETEVYTRVQA
jgi:hypothetical protein